MRSLRYAALAGVTVGVTVYSLRRAARLRGVTRSYTTVSAASSTAAPPPQRPAAAPAAAAVLAVHPSEYPKARRDDSVIDVYHGKYRVPDQYQWRVAAAAARRGPHLSRRPRRLEDPDGEETQQCAAALCASCHAACSSATVARRRKGGAGRPCARIAA